MDPFLKSFAAKLNDAHAGQLSKICIVFPNRRAGLFLQQYLSQLISTPIWMPQMFALEDFVIQLSGKKKSDPLELIAKLYKVYKSLPGDSKQSFADFIPWGNMLLSDFDEIDQYLADGEKVFTYLDELKMIQNWNPDGSPLTNFERKYLDFYNSLAPCYTNFVHSLSQTQEGYFGLIFKQLLSEVNFVETSPWEKVVFVGFNALTMAEEKLINVFLKTRKAEIYWDADNYYLNDTTQESGRFLRKYFNEKTFGEFNWVENSLLQNPINIRVLGVPGNIGQAKLAGDITKQLILKNSNVSGLAMVLVDEGMLLPVLNSIPEEVGDFNVTMGFPLKQTPLFYLITSLITLFVNAVKNQRGNAQQTDNEYKFYHKDIQRVITHPYLIAWNESLGVKSESLLQKSFYNTTDLLSLLDVISPKLKSLYVIHFPQKQIEVTAIILFVKDVLVSLFDFFAGHINTVDNPNRHTFAIDAEYLHQVLEVFDKLVPMVNDKELLVEPETLQSLLNALISGIKLPFYGEPLNGMQVMGMLETRLLDFPDVILISANEGLLPKKKHQNTFIPDEVRRSFGLQRYSEKNAVFAYHFYRLMQRANNVWILYNTEGDELGGGEKSRFVTQLLHELKSKNPRANIREEIVAQIPGNVKINIPEVKKTETVISRLQEIALKGISPTALASYMRCNLQFYYAQVLKIGEPEQVADTLDAAELGKIVHDALKEIYTDFGNGLITSDVNKQMQKSVVQYLEQAFRKLYSKEELSAGRNLLIVKVAEKMVHQLLKVEENYLSHQSNQISILLLEEWLSADVEIVNRKSGEIIKVKLHGQADRIDKIDNTIRIIDYKTGSVLDKELSIEEIGALQMHEEPSKILQVMLYALMYVKMNKIDGYDLQSGIISLLKPSSYLQVISIKKEKLLNLEILFEFENTLKTMLEEIFDSETPFKATLDLDKCKKCAFSSICNRVI